MCIKCEMKKLALREAGLKVERETLGTIPKHLYEDLTAAENKLEEVEEEAKAYLKFVMKKYENKGFDLDDRDTAEMIEKEVLEEYEDQLKGAFDYLKGIGSDVYKHLGIEQPESDEIAVNKETLEVHRERYVPIRQGAK